MVLGPFREIAPQLAEVAQLVEQWSEEPCVAGSSPALGTDDFPAIFDVRRSSADRRRTAISSDFRGSAREPCNDDREPFADAAGRMGFGWLTHSQLAGGHPEEGLKKRAPADSPRSRHT